MIQTQIALIANENGQMSRAVNVLNQCRSYFSRTGDKDALAKVYFHLAHLAFLNRKYGEISPYIIKLEEVLREIGSNEFLVPSCKHAILMLQYCVNKKIGVDLFQPILEKIKYSSTKYTPLKSPIIEIPVSQNIPSINVVAFGRIRVTINDREIKEEEWRSSRAKEIFLYLLSTRSSQTREQVAAALWPEFSPARGTSNFHINLYRARQAIMPVIFSQDRGKYSINPDINITFDLFQFQELIKISKTLIGTEKIKCLEKATDLYYDPFAPDIYGDWVEAIRHETEVENIKALSLLVELFTEQQNKTKAISTLERLIICDPYDEEAYGRMMELQLKNHDNAGARITYHQYRQNVVAETNVISSRVEQVYQKLVNLSR